MNSYVVAASTCLLLVAVGSADAGTTCSIHTPKGATDSQLQKLATVSKSDAEEHARARLKSMGEVSTVSAELEAEHGCLIWSFDMKVANHSGIQEVNVDAGNGQILAVHHESESAESHEAQSESSGSK